MGIKLENDCLYDKSLKNFIGIVYDFRYYGMWMKMFIEDSKIF